MEQSKQAKKTLAKIQDYRDVFSSPQGRKVLHDMMYHHGMMTPHPIDTTKAALKEGERLVILRILTLLKTDMKQLAERMEEYDRENATT